MKVVQKKQQRGFNLIEVIIVLGLVAAAIAGVMALQASAMSKQKTNDVITALNSMAASVRANFAPSSSYTAVTPANIIKAGMVLAPFQVNGDGVTIDDPWGGKLEMSGDASAFAFRVGGATLTKEDCILLASGLVRGANQMHIGAVTALGATSSTIAAGSVYKANTTTTPDTAALATGCAVAGPYIGIKFR